MTIHDLDLTSLRLFAAVCELRSIARAAQREHLVNSAVSKRMAQLERHMGTPLLVRKRYGVAPTPAGETLLEYARVMLANARRIDEAMAAYAGGLSGQVRLLANASMMAQALADDIVAFMQAPEHDGIRIEIEERLSPAVISGVREGMASLGIVWERAQLHGLQSRPYRCDHLGVVVPHDHPLAGRSRVAFADTLAWEHVGLPENSSIQRLFEQAALSCGQRLRGRVMVASYEAAMRVARARLAICIAPRELLGQGFEHSGLQYIPLTDDWAVRQFVLCFRDETQLSVAAQALVRHLCSVADKAKELAGI